MREVLLGGKYFKISGDIRQRRINPWKAKLGASGAGLEYSDFQNAELEEYHDFRNGIGKKRGVGSDARLDWSEGIDFANEGQAVLGPLVNTADYATWAVNTAYVLLDFRIPTTPSGYCYECTTAGTSHASVEPTWPTTAGDTVADGTVTWTCRAYEAPLKIIDFNDESFIISATRILKWDGTNIDAVYVGEGVRTLTLRPTSDGTKGFESTTGAGTVHYTEVDDVAADDATTRVYFTGASGTKQQEDLYGLTKSGGGRGTITHVKVYMKYMADGNVTTGYGGEVSIKTHSTIYRSTLDDHYDSTYKTINNTWTTNPNTSAAWTWDEIDALQAGGRVSARYDAGTYNGAITQVYVEVLISPSDADAIVITDSTDKYLVVSTPGAAVYTTDGTTWTALTGCKGFLAWYDSQLRSIDLDGNTLRSSPVNDVDGTWTTFTLTGYFGEVYDLFEGKLLSDGTPTLYFSGNEGLFTIDVTNEIAYKQEVEYPNLTDAGRAGIYWNANVWVASGYGILKVAPSLATFIGPDQDDGLPSGYQGKVYDLATVNNWLVFCVNGGTTDKSSIMKRNATLGGNLQVYTTSATNKAIKAIHHSSSSLYTNGRLWFGEGTSLKYMMFPDTTSNVKQIATYQYVNDSGRGDLPIFRKLAAINKTALGVAAITKSCDANEYVEVLYGLNGAAPTTSLGTFQTSPRATILTFGSGLGTEFYTIQLAVKLYRGSTATNSPELESLIFYYLPTPATILSWQFRIVATEDNSAEIISSLETIRDTNTLVAFYPSGDSNKTSYNVKLTQLPETIAFEQQGAKEGYLDCVLEEVFKG